MRVRERCLWVPYGTGEVDYDPRFEVYEYRNALYPWLGHYEVPKVSPIRVIRDPGITPEMVKTYKTLASYERFEDTTSYKVITLPPRPSRYKGRKPKKRKNRIRYVRVPVEKRLWEFLPCKHTRKWYRNEDGLCGSSLSLSHEQVDNEYILGCPGSVSHTVPTRTKMLPHIRFHDFQVLAIPPIEADVTMQFVTEGLLKSIPADQPGSLEALRKAAFREMVPDMENGFSLPVFIGELKDLPRMLNSFSNLWRNWGWHVDDFLGSPLKALSQLHLSAVFGWFPFIRDIKTIIKRLVNLRHDVDKFLSHAGMRQTYHYGRQLTPTHYRPAEFFYQTQRQINVNCVEGGKYSGLRECFSQLGVTVYESNSVEEMLYNATLKFDYQIPDVGEWDVVLASLDRFGINLSFSDIWELVPLSFIIDWFWNVQSLFEKLDFTNLPVTLNIREFCDSIKTRYAVKRRWTINSVTTNGYLPLDFPSGGPADWYAQDHKHEQIVPVDGWTATPGSDSCDYVEESYYRWAGELPDLTEDFPGWRTPNRSYQLVSLLAMIESALDHN